MRSAPDAARAVRSAGTEGRARQLAQQLRQAQDDPRRLAQELVRERLECAPPFLGEGTRECPWIVSGAEGDFHMLYVQGRELVQKVNGRPDAVVCVLSLPGRSASAMERRRSAEP